MMLHSHRGLYTMGTQRSLNIKVDGSARATAAPPSLANKLSRLRAAGAESHRGDAPGEDSAQVRSRNLHVDAFENDIQSKGSPLFKNEILDNQANIVIEGQTNLTIPAGKGAP